MSSEFCVLLCTASEGESEQLAKLLVEERLAACVNVTAVRSFYRWQGELCADKECLLIIKTVKSKIDRIVARINEVHSYEVPEILVLPVVAGSEQYLEWVERSVS
ncbi:MAG TPA: divalent-cation tolerance protein CutA [Methanomicrobia archaeon]|nr:divalent-cation tolerance protein CutA [Methanomicrobia archaeon]